MAGPKLVRAALFAAFAVVLSLGAQASLSHARADFPYDGHFGISTMTAGRIVPGVGEPLGGLVVPLRSGGSMRYGYCITYGKYAPGTAVAYGVPQPFTGTPANRDRATLGVMSMLIQRYGHTPGRGGADAVDINAAEVSATISHTYDEVDRNGQWRYLGQAGTSRASAAQLVSNARRLAGPFTFANGSLPALMPGGRYTYTTTLRNAYGPVGAGIAVALQAQGATLSSTTAHTDGSGHVAVAFTVPTTATGAVVTITASASVIDTMQVLRQQDSTHSGEAQDFVFSGPSASTYLTTTRADVLHPAIATQASALEAIVGSTLTDDITITGTAGGAGVLTATLYGPAASNAGPWTHVAGSVQVAVHGDGTYRSPGITVTSPGAYSWAEAFVPAGQSAAAATTTPGAVNETTTVSQLVVKTQASAQQAVVGSSLTDTIAVTGTAGTGGVVKATLYGPAASQAGPWTTIAGSVDVAIDGDGSFVTPPLRVTKPGLYSWAETFTPTGGTAPIAVTTPGEVSETTTVTAPAPPAPKPPAPKPPAPKPPVPRTPVPRVPHTIVQIQTGGDSAPPSGGGPPGSAGGWALVAVTGLAIALAFRWRA